MGLIRTASQPSARKSGGCVVFNNGSLSERCRSVDGREQAQRPGIAAIGVPHGERFTLNDLPIETGASATFE